MGGERDRRRLTQHTRMCVCLCVFVHMGLRGEGSSEPYARPLCTPQHFGRPHRTPGSSFPSRPPFSLALGCRRLMGAPGPGGGAGRWKEGSLRTGACTLAALITVAEPLWYRPDKDKSLALAVEGGSGGF